MDCWHYKNLLLVILYAQSWCNRGNKELELYFWDHLGFARLAQLVLRLKQKRRKVRDWSEVGEQNLIL